ncbi:hypothetical protein GCM10009578_046540 [Streptomyces rhizosphaericus]
MPEMDREILAGLLATPFPDKGIGVEGLFREISQKILPNSTTVAHPRFLAYVLGPPNGIGTSAIRSLRGPRHRRPGRFHSRKGYDDDHLRRWLGKRGIRHRIARKGIESSQQLGRHRRVVERTVSWLAGCRRLHRRYERKVGNVLAFVGIAADLICHRRLTS